MMKRRLLSALILLSATAVFAQSHLHWSNFEATPGMQANLFRGMATDKSGNSYTINFTQSASNFYVTYRFFAYDAGGAKKWQYDNDSCFTDCRDYYYSIVPVENAGAMFIGVHEDLTGVLQVRIKRIGANGQLIWQQYWNAPFQSAGIAGAMLDHSGHLVIAFRNAFVNAQAQENFAVAKFDTANGSNIWHLELPDGGGAQAASETFNCMDIDAANNIYLGGTGFNPFSGGAVKSYVFKVNASGSLAYQQQLTGINLNTTARLHTDAAGNIYLLGTGISGINDNEVRVEQHVASSGLLSWNQLITHDSASVQPVDFCTMNGETFVLSNYFYFVPDSGFAGGHHTNLHYSLTKLAYNGNLRWTRDYLTHFDDNATQSALGGAAQLNACNNALHVLSGLPLNDTASYLLLQKLDTAGNQLWLDSVREDFGIGEMATDDGCNVYVSRSARLGWPVVGNMLQQFGNFPTGIGVINNDQEITVYPNPANDLINVKIPGTVDSKNAVITIYDNLGRTWISQPAGAALSAVSVASLAPGVYYISVIAENRRVAVKMFVKQ